MEKPTQEKYALKPYHQNYLSKKQVLLVPAPTDSTAIKLASGLMGLLALLEGFRTLEDHAREAWKQASFKQRFGLYWSILLQHNEYYGHIEVGPGSTLKMLSGLLAKFVELGILIKESEAFRISMGSGASAAPPAEPKADPITSLGIVTCNRPENLERALDSYGRKLRDFGREGRLLVSDDSRDEKMQAENQRICREASARLGVTVDYVGRAERASQFLPAFTKAGVPEDVANFAVMGVDGLNCCGANRNSAFLASAGEKILMVDDDTIGRTFRPADFKDGIKVGSVENRMSAVSYDNREAALAAVTEENFDLLAHHERHTGQTLRELMHSFELGQIDHEKMDPMLFGQLLRSWGKVYVMHSGLVGDSGSNSALPTLFREGEAREKLLASEQSFEAAFQSREMTKYAPQATLNRAGPCMSTFFSADNRTPLPPFFPVQRDADRLWGAMVRAFTRDSLSVQSPWMLLHSPPEVRAYRGKAEVERFVNFTNSLSMTSLLNDFNLGVGRLSEAEGLARMARFFREIGRLPIDDFREYILIQERNSIMGKIHQFEAALEKYPSSPKYWKARMESGIESGQRALEALAFNKGNEIGVCEFLLQNGPTPMKGLQTSMARFAEVLAWWPQMFEVARGLERSSTAARSASVPSAQL